MMFLKAFLRLRLMPMPRPFVRAGIHPTWEPSQDILDLLPKWMPRIERLIFVERLRQAPMYLPVTWWEYDRAVYEALSMSVEPLAALELVARATCGERRMDRGGDDLAPIPPAPDSVVKSGTKPGPKRRQAPPEPRAK